MMQECADDDVVAETTSRSETAASEASADRLIRASVNFVWKAH